MVADVVLPLHSTRFLVYANVAYLSAVAILLTVCFGGPFQTRQLARWRSLSRSRTLKWVIGAYNVVCVVLAASVVVMIGVYKWHKAVSDSGWSMRHVTCTKWPMAVKGVTSAPTEEDHILLNAIWLFYSQKFFEFFDTIFFILKGSRRQVSLLHVYHHVSITIITGHYMGVMVQDGFSTGDGYLPALINSVVHVLLYSHYFMRIMCRHVGGAKPWWMSYLTSIQLIQFFAIAIGIGYGAVVCPENMPPTSYWLGLAYMGSMLVLFGRFFVRRYCARA